MKKRISFTITIFLVVTIFSYAATDPNSAPTAAEKKPCGTSTQLSEILSAMHQATQRLTSAQAEISYLTIEDPNLLDSRILRSGTLYYLKEQDRSYLRIQFRDLKQDDFEPESRRDEYLFDGVWLTRIDYKLEQIDMFQQAPDDKPVDVFELIRHNFPLVGFSDISTLEQDFQIELVQKPEDPNDLIHLLLKTRQNSPFSEEYTKLDFWIHKDSHLPRRILAHSTQGDVHDINFSGLQINKNLEKAFFTIEKPSDFRKNIEPLKENRK